MIAIQNVYSVGALSNMTTGNTLSVTADSLGCDFLSAWFQIGPQTNATAVPSIIGLQNGTTTTGPWSFYTNGVTNSFSPYTLAVSAFNWTSQTNYSTANTSGTDTLLMTIDIRNSPARYWKALCGGVGYTSSVGMNMVFSRLENTPWQSTQLTASSSFGTAIQPMFI